MRLEREKIYIYGKHALTEALLYAPGVIKKVFLSPESAQDEKLRELLNRQNVPIATLKSRETGHLVGSETAHQGVVAVADTTHLLRDFDEFVPTLKPSAETMLVLLDELTDPHNVGAIVRSAAAFGIDGVLIPAHRQAPLTGAVVKASAGMAFRLPLVAIGNINYTVDRLKKMGFRTYGLSAQGTQNITEEMFDAPALCIVGNENYGIRQKTLERCDVTLRIPMNARCESLNASVSAAIVFYHWSTRHPKALK